VVRIETSSGAEMMEDHVASSIWSFGGGSISGAIANASASSLKRRVLKSGLAGFLEIHALYRTMRVLGINGVQRS
jgi:hypothetical protein